jgi:hypothetical protein
MVVQVVGIRVHKKSSLNPVLSRLNQGTAPHIPATPRGGSVRTESENRTFLFQTEYSRHDFKRNGLRKTENRILLKINVLLRM